MASKLNHVAPHCLALVLCDAVIEDVRTRNKSLINMFNGILSHQVPVRHDKMCAFAAFSGGRGAVPISLRLCYDPEYEKDLLRMGGNVEFPVDNPQAVVDMVFEIRGFVFPQFGQYTFEIIADDVPILSRRFTITKAAPAPAKPSETEPEIEQ